MLSFHTNMKATVQSNRKVSESFTINCEVKQPCVLAPTLQELNVFANKTSPT